MVSITLPGLMPSDFLRSTLYDPSMLMGTSGRSKSIANLNAPRLKGLILPSLERDPSGKITSDIPRVRRWRAVLMVFAIAEGDDRSTST